MSRFPHEYGDWNQPTGRGGAQWFFPPLGYDAYQQTFARRFYASALITCVAKANISDGEYLAVRFNTNQLGVPSSYAGLGLPERTWEFEFDTVPDGVTPGRVAVNISADVTAAEVAARLLIALAATFNGTPLKLGFIAPATVALRTVVRWADLQVTDYVADAGFAIGALRATAIRPATFAAGPSRDWHHFNLRETQATALPVDIGSPVT